MPSNEIKDHLDGLSTLAVFIKLTARDGDIIAVTNATRDKIIDGITYHSVPLKPTQLEASNNLRPDNAELVTVLGGLYTSEKLRSHKWFGARVEYMVSNYEDFTMGPVMKRRGYIGKTTIGRYTARPEMLSLAQKLTQPVGWTMLETCNVIRYGDARCGVDLGGVTQQGYKRRVVGEISAITNDQQFTVTLSEDIKPGFPAVTAAPDDYFANGEVLFTSGPNETAEARVLSNTGNALTLWLPAFYTPEVGNTLRLTKGCNRTIDMCVIDDDNGERFRGYWMLPGREKIFRYSL